MPVGTASERRTQQERSEQTIALLLAAARELFGTRGYAATALEDVTRAAGVSKGALYHHFPGKPELFRAVFEREQERLATHVVAAARRRRDRWEAFFEGCREFLRRSTEPEVQRITLLDAPAVLGWKNMRELEAPHSFSVLRAAIGEAVEDGRLPGRDADVLAHLVLGAMCEAVAHVAASTRPEERIRSYIREMRSLLVPSSRR